SVTTVGEPVLLLPTVKTGGSESDLLYYLGWNFFPSAIPTDSLRVGELDPKFLVRCAICNTPRADVFELVRAVRYAVVGPQGSVQNRPCRVTSKPAIAGPEL